MLVIESAMRKELSRKKGCAPLIRVNSVPCKEGGMSDGAIFCQKLLKIDQNTIVFLRKLTHDLGIFIHFRAHEVGFVRLHIIGRAKNYSLKAVKSPCRLYHSNEILFIFMR